jgi:hypothetical protein
VDGSPKGMSQIYIRPSGLAVNQEVNLNEYIIKRLMPFIEKRILARFSLITLCSFGHKLA